MWQSSCTFFELHVKVLKFILRGPGEPAKVWLAASHQSIGRIRAVFHSASTTTVFNVGFIVDLACRIVEQNNDNRIPLCLRVTEYQGMLSPSNLAIETHNHHNLDLE
jgi:hypothetical protein